MLPLPEDCFVSFHCLYIPAWFCLVDVQSWPRVCGQDRVTAPFKFTSQRFVVREKRFTLQYAQIYARRLDELRPHVRAEAVAKWGAATEGLL